MGVQARVKIRQDFAMFRGMSLNFIAFILLSRIEYDDFVYLCFVYGLAIGGGEEGKGGCGDCGKNLMDTGRVITERTAVLPVHRGHPNQGVPRRLVSHSSCLVERCYLWSDFYYSPLDFR